MRDRKDGKETKWGEPSWKHDCSYAPYVNYGIKWMNQILPCHIIFHQEASHATKCGLEGNRVHWFIVTEQLGQCNKKQNELESSAKDPEWLWLLLSVASRKSISMLCNMIQDTVFAVVPFYRYGDWALENLKNLLRNLTHSSNLPYASLSSFIYSKRKLTNSDMFFPLCSSHHILSSFLCFSLISSYWLQ